MQTISGNQNFSHWDPRGGGRASGRETLGRVLGGAFAHMFLIQKLPSFQVKAFVNQVAHFKLQEQEHKQVENLSSEQIYQYPAGFPSPSQKEEVYSLLSQAKKEGESYGGQIELWLEGLPANLGQPVFHKLKADLAHALMGIGAIFSCSLGEENQTFHKGSNLHIQTKREDGKGKRYGGIRGGISSGERILLRLGMKPPSSLGAFARKGRHDPCILPRALAVVEAMSCFVLADHLLWLRQDHF